MVQGTGVDFETSPVDLVLAPQSETSANLSVTPKSVGILNLEGYCSLFFVN